MPEGPEIWRAADKLKDALEGKEVTAIRFEMDELSSYGSILKGEKVNTVEPRGKAILTAFSNGKVMYSHNQLYGKWYVRAKGTVPETNRTLRVAIHNSDHSAYLYSATDIEMLEKGEEDQHPYIQKLGPDVLHPDTSFNDVLARFQDDTFQNRKLTTLLLDQGFLSGIGNYLRSEILFWAGVSPKVKLRDCSSEEKQKLAEAAINLCRRSYETGGITNSERIVEALKREGASRADYRHFVYKRTGDFCHKCGSVIKEETTGGRKIYFCPSCQGLDSE